MKNKKKTIRLAITIFFIAICLVPVANSAEQTIMTLDYEEGDMVYIPGNVTLVFNESDGDESDVSIVWRIYSADTNITLYYFQSKTLDIDSDFINNTKAYKYKDTNSNTTYIVYVNYTSVKVPESIEDILNSTIDMQSTQITNLSEQLSNITNLYNLLLIKYDDTKAQNGLLTIQRDEAIAQNTPILAENARLENDLQFQEEKNNELRNEISRNENIIDNLEKSISQLSNPWSTGYEYYGEDQGFYFNNSSFIIGLAVAFLIIFLIETMIGKTGKRIRIRTKKTISSLQPKQAKSFDDVPKLEDNPKLKEKLDKMKKGTFNPEGEEINKTPEPSKSKNINDIESKIDEMFNNIEVQ